MMVPLPGLATHYSRQITIATAPRKRDWGQMNGIVGFT